MRALFVTAAVVLSVTAAQAQEMVPAKTAVAPESTDRAAMPSSAIVEQLKAAGELKAPKPIEAPAPKIDAVDAKPAEVKPVEMAKPVEIKPVEAEAVATKPVDARPARKRVVRTRETDEQKARRLAAKYGVTW
jgi:hypothetical protein